MAPSQVAWKHDFVESCRRLFLLCRHSSVTWPDPVKFVLPKIAQGLPHKVAPNPAANSRVGSGFILAPPPRRNVTYAVRHSVPLDGVLISRNTPYAADCVRCLKGAMFAWAHSFACRLRISTLMWKSANQRSKGKAPTLKKSYTQRVIFGVFLL